MTRVPSSVRTTAYLLACLFVAAGQVALTLAIGEEGWRGPSAASHVESRGIDQHYAHNEATCVTCMVLSLHARGMRVHVPSFAPAAVPSDAPAVPQTVLLVWTDAPANPPRAPPQLG